MDTIHLDRRTRIEFHEGRFPVVFVNEQPLRQTSLLRNLLDRLEHLMPDQESDRAHNLVHQVRRAIRRASLYSVTLHEGRRVFDGTQVAEKPPEYGRQRLLDGKVLHVDLPHERTAETALEPPEAILMRASREVAPLALLGVKPRDTGPSAVFLPDQELEPGLRKVFGDKITDTVLEEDRLDRVQQLTILAHREGQTALEDTVIPVPTNIVDNDSFDGLIADLEPAAWRRLLDAFQLPERATWLQVSVLDKEQGLATKGAMRRCRDGAVPATYSASWKIGIPTGSVPSSAMLVHESDTTYQPEASLNTQQLAYNFDEREQRALVDEVFVPGLEKLLDYEWTAKLRGVDRLLAAGADMRIEPVCERINKLRRKLAFERLHRVEVPGFRAKAAPDPTLLPYTCRVPEGTYAVGDLVDVTRDPSLPVGNSPQRFRVVGESQGFTIELGPDPWMTVMGGDYDGDDACVQQTTVRLFPSKTYDRTPVADFRNAKGRRRRGVKDDKARFEQALRVLERPIGPHDLTARRLMERGLLDREARVRLSEAIQAAIDSAKHDAEVIDPGYGPLDSDHAIDAVRRGDLKADAIKGTVYEPLVKTAVDVAEADLSPITFDPMPIRLAYAAMAARFPADAMAEPSRLAGLYGVKFAELCQNGCREIDIERLVDACCVEMEKVGATMSDCRIDMHGVRMSREELCLTAAEIALLRRASVHLASRVVRMKTLKLVFDPGSHFVRKALDAAKTHFLRTSHA